MKPVANGPFSSQEKATKSRRVILADDHSLVTEALRQLIAPYFDVVATVIDGHALLSAAESLKPDLVIVDIGMPLLNGLEACRQLKTRLPSVKFVFLTMNDDPELALEAKKIGASGYVSKKSAASELLQAIEAALQGKYYITPKIARGMQEFIHSRKGHSRTLTARQREVVQVLAEGKSMKEAGGVLRISPRTIAFHKYRIMSKLGLSTTADLVQYAIRNHIVIENSGPKRQ